MNDSQNLQMLCINSIIESDITKLNEITDDIFRNLILEKFNLDICSTIVNDKYSFYKILNSYSGRYNGYAEFNGIVFEITHKSNMSLIVECNSEIKKIHHNIIASFCLIDKLIGIDTNLRLIVIIEAMGDNKIKLSDKNYIYENIKFIQYYTFCDNQINIFFLTDGKTFDYLIYYNETSINNYEITPLINFLNKIKSDMNDEDNKDLEISKIIFILRRNARNHNYYYDGKITIYYITEDDINIYTSSFSN